jgi:hypothetical protein
VDGQELVLPSFLFAAGRDPLDTHTQAAVAAGVASRRYASTLDCCCSARLVDGRSGAGESSRLPETTEHI